MRTFILTALIAIAVIPTTAFARDRDYQSHHDSRRGDNYRDDRHRDWRSDDDRRGHKRHWKRRHHEDYGHTRRHRYSDSRWSYRDDRDHRYRSTRWVRDHDDLLLIDNRTGRILRVRRNVY